MTWIASEAAAQALAYAQATGPATEAAGTAGVLRLGTELERRFGLDADQRAEVLTQVDLRTRASRRWGVPVDDLFLTRDGLEQASRPAVARWRAERLRSFGVASIADLGCGLGLESRAFAAAGLRVTAVEIDARTALLAEANLRGTDARVIVGDVTDPVIANEVLDRVDAIFLDPARRDPKAPRSVDGLSGHRIASPEEWSPPWSWITSLAARVPRTVVKVAPGIDHALIPRDGSAVWTAIDGDLVEASVWFPGFAGLPHRSALAITGHAHATLDTTMPERDDVTAVGPFLLDLAPVVTRSGLVTTLAGAIDATRIDEHIGYLTCSSAPASSPWYTDYRVLDVLPFDRKRVGAALATMGGGPLTVMKRGFAADTELLRKQWLKSCRGSRALTVALTRIGDAPTAIICER